MNASSHSDTTKSHYEAHSASSYEDAFFYEPGEYQDYLVRKVRQRLGLNADASPKRRLLDIGGGTGNFTRQLVNGLDNVEAVVVDPFLEASSLSSNNQQVRFVSAGAECFIAPSTEWWRSNYHQVLLKEVIHHLDEKDRVKIYQGMRQELQSAGDNNGDEQSVSLLIITRPQYGHDYPLWDQARQVWAENQPSLEQLKGELQKAGFRHVQHTVESYPCSTPLQRWFDMIQSRFWSTFTNFTDKELEEACERIKRDEKDRVDDKGDIHFEDRLVFITAKK